MNATPGIPIKANDTAESADAKEIKLTLSQKILAIQDAVGVVKKMGKFGSEMGGGNYLRIEDAVVSVNKLMSKYKLILTGSLAKKSENEFFLTHTPHEKGVKDAPTRSGYIVGVIMDWKLRDTESLEEEHFFIPGDGYDSTDKAVYKSQTGSRKYAIINIFNLPIGNDVEEHGTPTFEESKGKAKAVAANKIAAAAAAGNKTAIDAMSQIEPERKLVIVRPEEMNGHYIFVGGLTAVPQLQTFFSDTGCKWLKNRTTGKDGWKVPAEYEKGLLALCEKLGIEVEG